MRIDQGQVADDIPGRIINDSGIRIVGWLLGGRAAAISLGVQESLVGDNRAINHITVHQDVKGDHGHIVRRACCAACRIPAVVSSGALISRPP